MIDENAIEDRRKTERLPTEMNVRISLNDKEMDAVLVEIGGGGAKIAAHQMIAQRFVSGPVVLHIPKFGEFHGSAAWGNGDFIGIAFNENHKALVSLIKEASAQNFVGA